MMRKCMYLVGSISLQRAPAGHSARIDRVPDSVATEDEGLRSAPGSRLLQGTLRALP